jgi:hypothetical protein
MVSPVLDPPAILRASRAAAVSNGEKSAPRPLTWRRPLRTLAPVDGMGER